MSKTAINRQQEGLVIANIDGAIKRISELKYVVKSQNGGGEYDVCSTDLGWVCSCPDHKFRGVKCKHIFGVEISFALQKEVEVARIEPLNINCCIFCNSSNIVKDGLTINAAIFKNTNAEIAIDILQSIWDSKGCAPLLKS
ncbi:MAG: hypothetical protein M3044_10955 [Thermoproteota archaeon]|nr:hypothetical protein [Thermoproteota archaeon]